MFTFLTTTSCSPVPKNRFGACLSTMALRVCPCRFEARLERKPSEVRLIKLVPSSFCKKLMIFLQNFDRFFLFFFLYQSFLQFFELSCRL